MTTLISILACLAILPKTAPAQGTQDEAVRLVEKLGSSEVAERDAAVEYLKHLGPKALPALRAARASADQEVAARAGTLLLWIDVDSLLANSIKRAIPDAVDRLARNKEGEWARILIEALVARYKLPIPRGIGENEHVILRDRMLEDLDPATNRKDELTPTFSELKGLVARALSQAEKPEEKALLCRLSGIARASDAAADLRRLLKDKTPSVRAEAARALCSVGSRTDQDLLVPLLKDPDPFPRQQSIVALRLLGAKEAAPALRPLLLDRDVGVRYEALRFAMDVGKDQLLPEIVQTFSDPELGLLLHSKGAWEALGGRTLIPRLSELQSSENPGLRQCADKVLKLIQDLPK